MVPRWTLPVIAALALLVAGCGSGEEGESAESTFSAPDQAQAQSKERPPARNGYGPTGTKKPTDKAETAPADEAGGKREKRVRSDRGDEASTEEPGGREETKKPGTRKAQAESPCPADVSRDRCLEMIRSSEASQGASKPVPQDRCPASFSEAECAAAVRAEEAGKGSQPQEPGQCPPSLRPEDCEAIAREAGY